MPRFIYALLALFVLVAPAKAACNDPSGFLKSKGQFNIGDLVAFGPDCQSLSDANNQSALVYSLSPSGNDNNDCITAPCATFPRVAALINGSPANPVVTIAVAAGNYNPGAIFSNGVVSIVGAGSSKVNLTDSSANGAAIRSQFPAQVGISGLSITSTNGSDIWALYGGIININSDVVFQSAPSARMACQDNGQIYGQSNFTVASGGGSLTVFLLAHCGMRFFGGPPVLTFTGSPVFSEIVDCINNGTFKTGGMQFVGAASVTNQYQMSENCVIDQEQNPTEFPGALQGQLSGGAVYYEGTPSFTGQTSGTTLTVTGMTAGNGALGVGNQITGAGVPANTKITAFGTGTGLNGTYTVNTSSSVGPVGMLAQSVFPCIDSVGLCPVTVSAPTGLGAGGTASVIGDGFGGDYTGKITMNAGSSGTSSTGAVFLIQHSIMTNCTASPSTAGTGPLSQISTGSGTSNGYHWFEFVWTASAALTANGTYQFNYMCR